MVSTSKVLTVSYGTFSCTLEGFDDSFDTMKAIAEYFRDLAADDRYFGAEPPTPDAEMLARIAEREIARRVEAHEQEGKILLRAAEIADDAAPLDETPDEEQLEDAVPVLADPEEPIAEAIEEAVEPAAEDVATQPAEAEIVDETAEEDAPEDADLKDALAGLTADSAEEEAEAPEMTEAEAEVEPELEQDPEPEQEPEPEPEIGLPTAEAHTPKAQPVEEDDSVAARLRRIRSVVAQSADVYEAAEYSEDEHAQDFLDQTAAELDAALAEDDAVEALVEPEDIDAPQDDPFAALTARLAEDETADDTLEDEDSSEPTREMRAASEPGEDTLAQLLADAMPAASEEKAEAEAEEPLVLTDTEQVAEEAPQTPLRARVVKMKRSEFEAAIAEGRIEEDYEAEAPEEALTEAGDDMLSPEDEAELLRELAEVEAEYEHPAQDEPEMAIAADPDDMDDDEEDVVDEAPAEPRGRRGAALFEEAGSDGDQSRLFDTADTHFEAPETSKRRNAIQHLRAAVAATKAEKKAGSTLDKDVDDKAYRSDLARVVRPRRPRATATSQESEPTRSRRPSSEPRQAPLKLVAEQRVDTAREPVRPRRVSAAQMAAESADIDTAGGFSEFAEELGASSLPELLEAAAAYMADIEGREQFSRPMLMGKLKEVDGDGFSREDGLRSFGHLLREGKLQKVKGGRFAITDQTEFRATGTRQAG